MKELEELYVSLGNLLSAAKEFNEKLGHAKAFMEGASADTFSPQEAKIVKLSAEGKTKSEIAKELNLSPRTVEVYRHNIRKRMGLAPEQSFQEAAKKWLK